MTEQKSFGTALLIWFFLGGLGGHRIYVEEKMTVVLWYWLLAIVTFSIIVWVDVFKLKGMVERANDPRGQKIA